MTVFVNSIPIELEREASLDGLLQRMNIMERSGMALAVNNSVVPRIEWENYFVKENDKVILIKATQGG